MIWVLTKPGRSGRETNSAIFGRLSFARFAQKGIKGLRSHTTVSAYWHAWQRAIDAGVAVEFKFGDAIDEPEIDFADFYASEKPDIDEAVDAAIADDPRGVANAAWAALRERREMEAERNEAQREQFLEADIRNLMEQHGCTRAEAEALVDAEKQPWIAEANWKAKRKEIGTTLRLARKLAERVLVVVDAVTAGEPILGDKELLALQETAEILQQVHETLSAALGQEQHLLDSDAEADSA